MSFLERILSRSEELGKKYDDHRPRKEVALPSSWAPRRSMPGFRRRRVIFAVVACLLIYLFIHNLPADFGSDLPNEGTRVSSRSSSSSVRQPPPKSRPPHHHKPLEGEDQYYEGAIKFYNLAISLQGAVGLGGSSGVNKNVLFAASSLQSASAIIPVACEMAQWNRNHVHFALMGRDDLDIEEIKGLNGIGDEDCNIHWHGRSVGLQQRAVC